MVLPPDDAPTTADRVWLIRRVIRGEVVPTDDDGILLDAGLQVVDEYAFDAAKTNLLVQVWER